MLDQRFLLAIFAWLLTQSPIKAACPDNPSDCPGQPGDRLSYTDDFDDQSTVNENWGIFEEIVNGNTCYGDEIGLVAYSDTISLDGSGSLMISSNDAGELKSNHVLGVRHLTDRGVPGKFTYAVWFHVDNATLIDTQTGPELSIQNTYPVGIDVNNNGNQFWRTNIGAFQYLGQEGRWNIWTKPDPSVDNDEYEGEQAVWEPMELPENGGPPVLDEDGWWTIEYQVEFSTDKASSNGQRRRKSRYLKYLFKSPSGQRYRGNLGDIPIAQENRGWNEGSLFITLEAQNTWTGCAEVKKHKAYYDELFIGSMLPVPVSPDIVPESVFYTTMILGETETYSIGAEYQVFILIDHPDVSLLEDGHTLSFTPTSTGGNGIKYKACDTVTYLCVQAWWDIQVLSSR